MSSKNIIIIGGRGGMGRLLGSHFKAAGHEVAAIGRADWEEKKETLSEADLVIVSVPIAATEETIVKASPYLGKKTILSDFTSIKQKPIECMMKHHSGTVLGMHPVFGPSVKNAHQQVIVLCPGREHHKCEWIGASLEKAGFNIVNMSAKEHDEAMTIIQALKHFSTYCLGTFLKKQNVDLSLIKKLASPIYRLEMDMLGRIFSQDAELYADIIMADEGRIDFLKDYVSHMSTLFSGIEKNDKQDFLANFNTTTDWMGDFAKESLAESDRVIELVNQKD
ncbi:MAG: bifunctional chorismate mutase/prephenate dehydrogenase [Planctomycetes bacterium]|nr:bifunctional chorismate mutase/prephenate dehydrogenase [Planctomycetota bacterium]